jgi:hypothetical protein
MFALSLRDDVSPTLAAMPERLRDALSSKADILAATLQAKIKDKLSSTVLNSKTGALARSIVMTIDDSAADLSVTMASSGDIKYAAIQEYGGTIPPHEILPDKAKALAFAVGGKQAFAARANLSAITLPERSYMRSSLAEMADEIRIDLNAAAVEVLG